MLNPDYTLFDSIPRDVQDLVLSEEGSKDYVYKDILGNLTGGVGHKLVGDDLLNYKEGDLIEPGASSQWFKDDLSKAYSAATEQAQQLGLGGDTDFIKRLTSVNYQLGENWWNENVNPNALKNTWAALEDGNYGVAAREALDSEWNLQEAGKEVNRAEAFADLLNNLDRKYPSPKADTRVASTDKDLSSIFISPFAENDLIKSAAIIDPTTISLRTPPEREEGLLGMLSTGFLGGLQQSSSDYESFKGALNLAIGRDEAAQLNIARANFYEELASEYLNELAPFKEFWEAPTLMGGIEQVFGGLGKIGPQAIETVSSALAGGGIGLALKGSLSLAGKAGAKKITKELLEKKARGETLDAAEEALLAETWNVGNYLVRGGAIGGAFLQEYKVGTSQSFKEFQEAGRELTSDEAFAALGLGLPQAIIGTAAEVVFAGSLYKIALRQSPLAKIVKKGELNEASLKGQEKALFTIYKKYKKNGQAGLTNSELGRLRKASGKIPGQTKKQAAGSFFAKLAQDVATATGISAVTEGTAEVLQEGISVAQRFAIDENYSEADAKLRIAEAAFLGALPGGAVRAIPSATVASIFNQAKASLDASFDYESRIQEQESRTGPLTDFKPEPASSLNAQLDAVLDKDTRKRNVFLREEDQARNPEFVKRLEGLSGLYKVSIPGQGLFATQSIQEANQFTTLANNTSGKNYDAFETALATALGYSETRKPSHDRVVEVVNAKGEVVWQQSTDSTKIALAQNQANKLFGDLQIYEQAFADGKKPTAKYFIRERSLDNVFEERVSSGDADEDPEVRRSTIEDADDFEQAQAQAEGRETGTTDAETAAVGLDFETSVQSAQTDKVSPDDQGLLPLSSVTDPDAIEVKGLGAQPLSSATPIPAYLLDPTLPVPTVAQALADADGSRVEPYTPETIEKIKAAQQKVIDLFEQQKGEDGAIRTTPLTDQKLEIIGTLNEGFVNYFLKVVKDDPNKIYDIVQVPDRETGKLQNRIFVAATPDSRRLDQRSAREILVSGIQSGQQIAAIQDGRYASASTSDERGPFRWEYTTTTTPPTNLTVGNLTLPKGSSAFNMNEVLKAGRQLFLREQFIENDFSPDNIVSQNLSYNQELVLGFNSLLAIENGLINYSLPSNEQRRSIIYRRLDGQTFDDGNDFLDITTSEGLTQLKDIPIWYDSIKKEYISFQQLNRPEYDYSDVVLEDNIKTLIQQIQASDRTTLRGRQATKRELEGAQRTRRVPDPRFADPIDQQTETRDPLPQSSITRTEPDVELRIVNTRDIPNVLKQNSAGKFTRALEKALKTETPEVGDPRTGNFLRSFFNSIQFRFAEQLRTTEGRELPNQFGFNVPTETLNFVNNFLDKNNLAPIVSSGFVGGTEFTSRDRGTGEAAFEDTLTAQAQQAGPVSPETIAGLFTERIETTITGQQRLNPRERFGQEENVPLLSLTDDATVGISARDLARLYNSELAKEIGPGQELKVSFDDQPTFNAEDFARILNNQSSKLPGGLTQSYEILSDIAVSFGLNPRILEANQTLFDAPNVAVQDKYGRMSGATEIESSIIDNGTPETISITEADEKTLQQNIETARRSPTKRPEPKGLALTAARERLKTIKDPNKRIRSITKKRKEIIYTSPDAENLFTRDGDNMAKILSDYAIRTLGYTTSTDILTTDTNITYTHSENATEYVNAEPLAASQADKAVNDVIKREQQNLINDPKSTASIVRFNNKNIIIIQTQLPNESTGDFLIRRVKDLGHELGHGFLWQELSTLVYGKDDKTNKELKGGLGGIPNTFVRQKKDGTFVPKKNPIFEKIYAAYEKDIQDSEQYRGEFGFEEWYADKFATDMFAVLENRAPKDAVESFFYRLLKKLKAFFQNLNREAAKRFGPVPQEFQEYMSNVRNVYKDNLNNKKVKVPVNTYNEVRKSTIEAAKVFNNLGQATRQGYDKIMQTAKNKNLRSHWGLRYLLYPTDNLMKFYSKEAKTAVGTKTINDLRLQLYTRSQEKAGPTGPAYLNEHSKRNARFFSQFLNIFNLGTSRYLSQKERTDIENTLLVAEDYKNYSDETLAKALELNKDSTEGKAARVRIYLRNFHKSFLEPLGVPFNPEFFPRALAMFELIGKPELQSRLAEILAEYNPEDAKQKGFDFNLVVERLVNEDEATIDGIDENNPLVAEEGSATDLGVGGNRRRQQYFKNVRNSVLRNAGLLKDPIEGIREYLNTMAKRIQYNESFKTRIDNLKPEIVSYLENRPEEVGGGIFFSQAEKSAGEVTGWKALEVQLAQIAVAEGPKTEAKMRHVIRGMLGKAGQDMSAGFRNTNSFLLFFNAITLLTLAPIASFPDLAGPIIHGGDLRSFSSAVDFAKQYAFGGKEGRDNARKFALDLGVVAADSLSLYYINAAEQNYMNPTFKKGTDYFFRYTGLEAYTQFTRIFAAQMGKQFLIRAAEGAAKGDNVYTKQLESLGVTPAQVKAAQADNFALTGSVGRKHTAVRTALGKFVDESIVRPNAAERPGWANNPYYATVWQLKSFYYAYGKVIMGGLGRTIQLRYQEKGIPDAAVPLLMGAALLLPLTALGLELRELVKFIASGGDASKFRTNRLSNAEYTGELIDRAGVLGPFGLLIPMIEAQRYDDFFIGPALGPSFERIEDLLLDGEIKQNIPVFGTLI